MLLKILNITALLSVFPLLTSALPTATNGILSERATCSVKNNIRITFFGIPDNDPAGSSQTAYDCGKGRNFKAGGTGSYDDPLTFATAPGEFKQCEILYLPYIKKYVRMEDYCQACTEDWASGRWHIDIWTSNDVNGGDPQVQCENVLTPDGNQSVIRDPAKNLETDLTPLFVPPKTCNKSHVFNNNSASKYCKK